MAKEGLQFEFSASTAEYRKAVESMPRDLQKAADEIEHIGQEINSSLGDAIGKGLVQGLAGAGAALKLRDVISQFDQVSDAAKRFGTTAEDIQRVDFASKSAGSSMEAVAQAMDSAGLRANKAARGAEELGEAFNRAGIDATAFSMADLSERIEMVARAQNSAAGDSQQLANIIEALGQSAAGVDFVTMADGMRGVNVLSNETVRQLSQANDAIVKFERNFTLALGAVLGGLGDVSERIGSIIAKEGSLGAIQRALLALTPAAPLSLMGGQTIEEMEQAEEALNGLPPLFEKAAQSADVAAESAVNYSQVLKQLVEVNAEMEASMARMEKGAGALGAQLAEAELRLSQLSQEFAQSGDADVFKEIEKTAKEILTLRQQTAKEEEKIRSETAKTSEEYRKQADAQARSIVSIDEEIQMLEAKLGGNEALTEEIQRQQDFRKAFEKTRNVEQADKLADLLSRERQMESGAQSPGQRIANEEAAARALHAPRGGPRNAPPSEGMRAAMLRGESRGNRARQRGNELAEAGMFRSAVRAFDRADRTADRIAENQRVRDFYGSEFGAGNAGEAFGEFRDMFGGLNSKSMIEKGLEDAGLKYDPTRDEQANFDRLAREQSKSPEERAREERERREREEEEMRQKHAPPGGRPDTEQGIINQIHSLLQKHMPSIDEKLPQHALVPG
jgi:hypothetical protein